MMSSSAFAALFRLNVYIVCPSSLEGAVTANTYDAESPDHPGTVFTVSGVKDELVKVGSADNIYTMKTDVALGCWGDLLDLITQFQRQLAHNSLMRVMF